MGLISGTMNSPLSTPRRRGEMSPGCLVLFFGVFLAAGCIASYFLLWKPWSAWFAARSWRETPCTVESSRVAESSDSDGTTYKVEISYVYYVAPADPPRLRDHPGAVGGNRARSGRPPSRPGGPRLDRGAVRPARRERARRLAGDV